MAKMTFKADLVPNSDYGYSLGSTEDSLRWKINGFAGSPIEYILDTKTGSSSAWTGVTKDSSLTVGKVIAFKITNAPSGNASLNLTFTNPPEGAATSSGAIPVYLNNTRVTTHYANGSVVLMVYDGTNWRSTDYWNSNSRDAGYGKITPQQSDAETAITPNTTQIVSTTYTEAMKVAAGNKWVQLAGTNGGTGTDVLTIGHSLSGATVGNYGDSSAQTPSYGGTFNVPYISVDAAGHVTGISTHTVQIPASDNTTYTFNDGTAGNFTVTPSGGTAQTVSIGKPATAGTADKATADASGNTITATYLTKASGVTAVTWDSTNKKITRTINGSASDVVQFAAGSNITLTGASGKLTIASTDTNNAVTQAETTTDNDYRLLLSSSADTATTTAGAGKSTNLRFNPSSKVFSVGGDIEATGDLELTGNANLNGETYADSVTAGSLLVTGAAAFTNIPTAPTPDTTSNDTSVATTAFVKNNLGGLSGAMHFKGTTTTTMSDGLTTAAVTIGGSSYTPTAGDVVLYSDSEFVWTGSAWERLGRDSSFKTTQTAVTGATTASTATATTFVSAIEQDANGVIKYTTKILPTYNNYSLPTASTSTKGGIKVGTGLTMSGEALNHSNAVTAQTTQAVYPVKIDAQGHISAYGSAVTSMTPTSHTHGNITNDGKITTTATIASGDKIVIVDSDTTAASKITGSSITFGTSANYALANDGTWQAFTNITYSSTTPKALGTASVGSENAAARGDHVHPKPTPADIGAAAASHGTHVTYSSTTPKALGTAAVGSENAVARGDHVHPKPSLTDLGAASSTHTHGNITNDGKIGSTANYAVYTTTDGAVTATSFAVTSPDASGTTTAFIDTISQDSKGQISATKKTVTSATTSTAGIMAMSQANLNTMINQLGTGSSTPVDGDYYISQYVNGGTATTTYHRRPMSALYDYVKGKLNVTNNNINLSRNTETTIATIGGTAIKIKLPASDNTDTKQNIVLATTTKAYLTGVTTAPTSTTAAMTGVGDTGVYLTSTAGELSAVRHSFNINGAEQAYMSYNTTTNAIDFVFV